VRDDDEPKKTQKTFSKKNKYQDGDYGLRDVEVERQHRHRRVADRDYLRKIRYGEIDFDEQDD
jgi:hypothetical protein